MKKWEKRALLLGLVCCGLGLGIGAAGLVFGGRAYVRQADLNSMDAAWQTEGMESADTASAKAALESFSALAVDMENYDLQIAPSEDGTAYLFYDVETNDGKLPFTYTVENDTLSIQETDGSGASVYVNIGFLGEILGTEKSEHVNVVTLYVPKETLADCKIKLHAGDLAIAGLAADNVQITDDYGDIAIENSTLQGAITSNDGDVVLSNTALSALTLSMKYGDFTMADGSAAALALTSEDGDVSFQNTAFSGKNTVELEYGDFVLHANAAQLDALGLQAQTEYGDISVSGADGEQYGADDAQTYRKNVDAADLLTVKSADGDITVRAQ